MTGCGREPTTRPAAPGSITKDTRETNDQRHTRRQREIISSTKEYILCWHRCQAFFLVFFEPSGQIPQGSHERDSALTPRIYNSRDQQTCPEAAPLVVNS